MKQYLLAVHDDATDAPPTAEVMAAMFADVEAFNVTLREAGAWVFAGGLQPADVATVVRATDGEVMITNGPFAETTEHLGGFWVIRAADLDEALSWAAKGAAACQGPVEVRPFQDDAED